MRLRDIPEENRPRERLWREGVRALSDAELLAVVLHTGTLGENVLDLANRILAKYPLRRLAACSPAELQRMKGIGPAKAAQLLALFALHRRTRGQGRAPVVSSPARVAAYVRQRIPEPGKECALLLFVNAKHTIVGDAVLSIGTLTSAAIHPREVFLPAVREGAYAVIVAHNHPSGDPAPSDGDREVTARLVETGSIVGIPVLDHVIVGEDSHYSFREEGEIIS